MILHYSRPLLKTSEYVKGCDILVDWSEMDSEDLESNLNALRQLYQLLQKDQNGLQNLTSDLLDDKSRLLLKDLLDLAAEKVFKVHSEVLDGQSDLSLTECSNNALQRGDAWNPPENLAVIDRTGLDRNCRLKDYARQRTSLNKSMPIFAANGSGNGHKYCRICQQRITRNSTDSSTVSATRDGAKGTALPNHQSGQSSYCLWDDEKEGPTATTELPQSPSDGKNKQRGTTVLEIIPSGLESKDSFSDGHTTDLVDTESVRELTAKTTQEFEDPDSLSKEASDVVKQIEMCILDLRRGFGNLSPFENTKVSMHAAAQRESSDMMTDFSPNGNSAFSVALEKSQAVTGCEPSQTNFSATRRNGSLREVENRRCKDTSPQYRLPSRETGLPKEMTQPSLTASLKPLSPKNAMVSPVSVQRIGKYAGFEAGHYMQRQSGYSSEAIKGLIPQNQMVDMVFDQNDKSIGPEIESLSEATTSKCLLPRQIENYNGLWPKDKKLSKIVSSVYRFPQQINEEDLHRNQIVFRAHTNMPGTYQKSRTSKVSKHHKNPQKVQARISRYKVASQTKKPLPFQTDKRQPSPMHQHDQFSPLSTSNSRWKDQDQVGVPKNNDQIYPSRKIMQHQHESDDTSLSSNSSNWTSQQTSMSNSGSEDYNYNYISPTTSSSNDTYSVHPRSQRPDYFADESSSENEEDYMRPSRKRAYQLTSYSSNGSLENSFSSTASYNRAFRDGDSESEDKDSSMYNQPRFQHYRHPRYNMPIGFPSKKISSPSPTRAYKPSLNKRVGGRWKKMRDKLAIIFHHHHHHHHQHHHNHLPDDDPSDNENRIKRGKFLSKHIPKTSHHPTRTEGYGGETQTLEAKGKSVIHNGDHKNRHNRFNALVGGFLKHIRHSEESKPFAKHIKRLGKDQSQSKKLSAKLHWWQLLQRHRRANKLGLGYGKR